MRELPYITDKLPGIGGRIKERPEDFRVTEQLLAPPGGRGRFICFRLTKKGMSTPLAVLRVARYLGIDPERFGFAGLKDAQAVTTQWMSVERADARRLERFRDRAVRVSDITPSDRPMRLGELAGNEFRLKIRGVGKKQLAAARQILEVLVARGAPNYFGPQRFGMRGDTGDLGAAMVANDLERFVRIFLGGPLASDPPPIQAARRAFDDGRLDQAIRLWPRSFVQQRQVLAAYKRRRNPVSAIVAVDSRLKRLFVAAFQSEIFNRVLQRRLATFDRLLEGDLAIEHATEGIIAVEDPAALSERCVRLELSATGPIFGSQCPLAAGAAGRIEQAALDEYGVRACDFARVGKIEVKGSRRPLRFAMGRPALYAGRDGHGEFIELDFFAPSGCYATVVLGEMMKANESAGMQGMQGMES